MRHGMIAAALVLASLPAAVQMATAQMAGGAAPRSRPMHEMRGGCDNFGMDLSAEFQRWAGPAASLQTVATLPASGGPMLRPGELVDLQLLPDPQVQHAVPPRQDRRSDATFGGLLRVELPSAGRWRFSASAGGNWFDLLGPAGPLHDPWFEMQTGCDRIFKSVVFEVPAAGTFVMPVSANRNGVLRLLVTPDQP